jgi:ABC-type nitrate/sulfonate/bicarbonate transport system substrate-binding protein
VAGLPSGGTTGDVMRIRQSFFVPPVPFLIAEDRRLFAKVGLEVESRRTRSSGEQIDGLISRDIDLAVTAMDNIFVWSQRGVDLRIVAQIEATTLLTIYGRPGIHSLKELAGGRFAVDALTNGFALVARRMLEDAEVPVSFVEVGGVKERLDALLEGAADGTLLGPPLDELAERQGMTVLASANDTLPELAGQGVIVRAARSEEETEALVAYLRVLDEATAFALDMSDEEGVELLAANGFQGRSAVNVWRTRPRSLAVDARGVALIETLREGLQLLPDGYRGSESIVDETLRKAVHHP